MHHKVIWLHVKSWLWFKSPSLRWEDRHNTEDVWRRTPDPPTTATPPPYSPIRPTSKPILSSQDSLVRAYCTAGQGAGTLLTRERMMLTGWNAEGLRDEGGELFRAKAQEGRHANTHAHTTRMQSRHFQFRQFRGTFTTLPAKETERSGGRVYSGSAGKKMLLFHHQVEGEVDEVDLHYHFWISQFRQTARGKTEKRSCHLHKHTHTHTQPRTYTHLALLLLTENDRIGEVFLVSLYKVLKSGCRKPDTVFFLLFCNNFCCFVIIRLILLSA